MVHHVLNSKGHKFYHLYTYQNKGHNMYYKLNNRQELFPFFAKIFHHQSYFEGKCIIKSTDVQTGTLL